MTLKRCESGHLFDPAKHVACPYCGVQDIEIGLTRPKSNPAVPGFDNDVTASAKKPIRDGETRRRDQKPSPGRDPGATVGFIKKKTGIDPVVGWLVCVSGPDRGRDYRIRGEKNFVGRAESNDICIAGDSGVSREKHAFISYNPKKNSFKLGPGDSRGMVYLNDDDVDTPADLKPYDRITLGETVLVFIPFCSEQFQWEAGA